MSRVVAVAVLCLSTVAVSPSEVLAQTSSAASTAAAQTSPTPGFLTSYRFHLNALRLNPDNDNFVWDTDFGGDLDVFDLQYFRGNVLVNFETIFGRQIRAIDPNQGNYTVDLSAWWRTLIPDAELGLTFHHVSRHLSDRDKDFSIAWNMLGFQYTTPLVVAGWDLDIGYRLLKTVRRSFVDYTGEVGGSIQTARTLNRRVSLIAAGEVTLVSVDSTELGRGNQFGNRIEIGLRFPGRAGDGEVFLSREQRIDADPFDLEPTLFTMAGFRFLSK
jgi:hypothetical protein